MTADLEHRQWIWTYDSVFVLYNSEFGICDNGPGCVTYDLKCAINNLLQQNLKYVTVKCNNAEYKLYISIEYEII